MIKLTAMIIAGAGGLFLISEGEYVAGGTLLGTLAGFAVGDANGAKRIRKAHQDDPRLDALHRL